MLSDDSDAAIAELSVAISEHDNHRVVPDLLRILAGHVSVAAPDMRAVLKKFGTVEMPDDLVREVECRRESHVGGASCFNRKE